MEKKKVVIGVTGSIAAYKMANVANMLVKQGHDVHVIMTKNAAKFITPTTFETLTKNPCFVDTFDRETPILVHHIELGQTADVILVAPASANVLAKMAYGLCDDMLTSVIVAATCPILVAPAMNSYMYENNIVQENIRRLKSFGFHFIEPAVGRLACDVVGVGKLPEDAVLFDAVEHQLSLGGENGRNNNETNIDKKDLMGRRVLVTAGPTRESLDPVRYITNHSTGKMGYAIAEAAAARGAKVILVSGPVAEKVPSNVTCIPVVTAKEMYEAVMEHRKEQDIIIKAAAVADYSPKKFSTEKVKKQDGELIIELERTKDILAELGENKGETQCICGFSMETEHVIENSKKKLKKKHADLIAANSLREDGAGFGTDTNHLFLITETGEEDAGMLRKEECAHLLLDRLESIWKAKQGRG